MKPDISEYYKGLLACAEEQAWASSEGAAERAVHVRALEMAFKLFGGTGVLELCCGTGWIPLTLLFEVVYTGVDNNAEFLVLASDKNSVCRRFIQDDLRKVSIPWLEEHGVKEPDIVCCFAALKHFGLHEWDAIFGHMLDLAPTAVFDVQITPRDVDDGKEFHHVSVTRERVGKLLADHGHGIFHEEKGFSGKLGDGVTPMSVKTLVTCRK
jgi:SAM-dependent methyltransferase